MLRLLCFHCSHEYENEGYLMPSGYDTNNVEYSSNGERFCSFECMKTYNIDLNDSFKNIRCGMINEMYKSMYENRKLKFAPRRTDLIAFGGKLTIQEFRQTFHDSLDIINVLPIRNEYIFNNIKQEVAIEYKSISQSSNEAPPRLNRTKPLKSKQNTLEMSMGIFKTNA